MMSIGTLHVWIRSSREHPLLCSQPHVCVIPEAAPSHRPRPCRCRLCSPSSLHWNNSSLALTPCGPPPLNPLPLSAGRGLRSRLVGI